MLQPPPQLLLLFERHDPAPFPFVVTEVDDDDLVEQVEGLGKLGVGKRKQSDEARLGEKFPQPANCWNGNYHITKLIHPHD